MIEPEFADKDEVLEYAARLIEEVSLLDAPGLLARRKRAREDAALRLETARQVRAECAKHIRAMKARPDLDAKVVLRRLADLRDDHRHDAHLRDAWPLAWKGWVDIKCTVRCNSNSVPPAVEFRIELTERGRAILQEATP